MSESKIVVSKLTLFRRIFSFRNILIFLIISFTILMLFANIYPYFSFDLVITRFIQQFRPFWFDELMKLISKFGNLNWAIISTLVVSTFLYLLKKRKEAMMIFISSSGGLVISLFFKYLIARPRPDDSLIIQVDKFFLADSFPSGHVMFYISFYGFLLFLTYIHLKKILLRNILLLIFSLPLILGGLSRVYLGVHWFSDVLGAYLIGSIWLIIIFHIYKEEK